MKDMKQSTALI